MLFIHTQPLFHYSIHPLNGIIEHHIFPLDFFKKMWKFYLHRIQYFFFSLHNFEKNIQQHVPICDIRHASSSAFGRNIDNFDVFFMKRNIRFFFFSKRLRGWGTYVILSYPSRWIIDQNWKRNVTALRNFGKLVSIRKRVCFSYALFTMNMNKYKFIRTATKITSINCNWFWMEFLPYSGEISNNEGRQRTIMKQKIESMND